MLDTDCLVAAAYAEGSASRRVLEACLCGEVIALVSPDLQHEYEYILGRAGRGRDFHGTLQQFLARAEQVHPTETPRVVPDDPADDKLVAAALAGRAGGCRLGHWPARRSSGRAVASRSWRA